MKAVVMEIGRKYTIVLTRQGDYVRVKTLPHYRVGYEIECPPVPAVKYWIRYASAAAVLVFFIGLGGLVFTFTTPYSYVNLDINPSVEMTVNRFDYIIQVKGMNPDGDALLSKGSVLYKSLQAGVGILLERLDQEGYLPSDSPSTLVLTIVSEDQRKIDRFDQTISEAISQKLNHQSKVDVYVIHTDLQTHTDAEKHNLSSGRFLLIQELQKTTGQDLNPNEMKDVPITEIVRMVREKTPKPVGDERSNSGQGLLKSMRPPVQQREKGPAILERLRRQNSQQDEEPQKNRQRQELQDVQQIPEPQDNLKGQERVDSRNKQERQDVRSGKKLREDQQVIEQRESRPGQEGKDSRQEQAPRDKGQPQERLDSRQKEEQQDNRPGENRRNKQQAIEGQENRQIPERQKIRQEQERQDNKQRKEGQDSRERREVQEYRQRQERDITRPLKGGEERNL